MDRVAAVDIGTNTFRLLIAERGKRSQFVPIMKGREVVRLGEGYHVSSRISKKAITRGINTLTFFTEKMKENEVTRYLAVSTGVVRKAANASEFLSKVKKECGMLVKVISGEEEAMLTMKGVGLVFPKQRKKGTWVIFDIGGGSTELIYCEDGHVKIIESLDIGVVTLSGWMNSDPPIRRELKAIENKIEKILRPSVERIMKQSMGKRFSLIGTAGTVTTLAAMDQALPVYQPEKINGILLRKDSIKDMFYHLIALEEREREMLPGLEKGRGKVIIPGCAILLTMMDMFQVGSVSVSDSGLLEGVLTELLEFLDNPRKVG